MNDQTNDNITHVIAPAIHRILRQVGMAIWKIGGIDPDAWYGEPTEQQVKRFRHLVEKALDLLHVSEG